MFNTKSKLANHTKSKLANQTKSKLAKLFPADHQRPPPHNFDVSAV